MEIQVLYQDDDLIIIDKPVGMSVIPEGYDISSGNLLSILRTRFPELMVVHRLDKTTSGILVFARNKNIHREICTLFEKREVAKNYTLIAHNQPEWEKFNCSQPIQINSDRRHRTIVKAGGKPAETFFMVLRKNSELNLTLMSAAPKTGYTYQIRSHLTFLGYPVLGDHLYQKGLTNDQKIMNQKAARMMLHASSISFIHPYTQKPIHISSLVPFSLEELENKSTFND